MYLSLLASFCLDMACSLSFPDSSRFDKACPYHFWWSCSILFVLIATGQFPSWYGMFLKISSIFSVWYGLSLSSPAVRFNKACTYRSWHLFVLIRFVPYHFWLLSSLKRIVLIISGGPVRWGLYLSLLVAFRLDEACSLPFLAPFRLMRLVLIISGGPVR